MKFLIAPVAVVSLIFSSFSTANYITYNAIFAQYDKNEWPWIRDKKWAFDGYSDEWSEQQKDNIKEYWEKVRALSIGSEYINAPIIIADNMRTSDFYYVSRSCTSILRTYMNDNIGKIYRERNSDNFPILLDNIKFSSEAYQIFASIVYHNISEYDNSLSDRSDGLIGDIRQCVSFSEDLKQQRFDESVFVMFTIREYSEGAEPLDYEETFH